MALFFDTQGFEIALIPKRKLEKHISRYSERYCLDIKRSIVEMIALFEGLKDEIIDIDDYEKINIQDVVHDIEIDNEQLIILIK